MNGEGPVKVYYVVKEWVRPDGELSRWKLIAEYNDPKTRKLTLGWIYTYNPKLAVQGMQLAELYRDSSYRLCIRVKR